MWTIDFLLKNKYKLTMILLGLYIHQHGASPKWDPQIPVYLKSSICVTGPIHLARIFFIIYVKQQLTASKTTEKAFYDDSSQTPFTTDIPISYTNVRNNETGITFDVWKNINLHNINNGSTLTSDNLTAKESNTEKEGNKSEARLLLSPVYTKIRPTKLDSKVMQLEANAELLLANTNRSSGSDTERRAQIDHHDHKISLKMKNVLHGLFTKFVDARESDNSLSIIHSANARKTINDLKKQFSFMSDLLSIFKEFNRLLLYIKELAELIKRRIIPFVVYSINVILQWKENVMKKNKEIEMGDVYFELVKYFIFFTSSNEI